MAKQDNKCRNGKLCLFAFYARAAEIKNKYPWIYNPPPIPSKDIKSTAGSTFREDFLKYYGGYPEMVYSLLQGKIYTSKEQIYQSKTNEFLFWVEFLIRKKTVENIE